MRFDLPAGSPGSRGAMTYATATSRNVSLEESFCIFWTALLPRTPSMYPLIYASVNRKHTASNFHRLRLRANHRQTGHYGLLWQARERNDNRRSFDPLKMRLASTRLSRSGRESPKLHTR